MEMAQPESGFKYGDISEPYYFESDHVALKENEDYRNLLHTIALLESQRTLAAQDIETLHKAQSKALEDPISFVENLQRGKCTELPRPQVIPSLPEINWDNYTSSVDFSSFGSKRHMTRNKKNDNDQGGEAVRALKSKLIQGFDTSINENDASVVVVRGRAKDSSKPETFNQLWTEEEQQRLERLLIQFPPEEVESRRWSKIAEALGNRTPIQVASRVQKYFVRLAREGLPVPGRMPNLAAHTQRGTHRHHRYNRLYTSTSTFLQSHVPPVWMGDEGEESGITFSGSGAGNYMEDTPFMSENASQKDESSDDEGFPPSLQNTPEYRELQKLKRVRREKLAQERRAFTRHIGFKCDNCSCEPIVGTRWHCIDCPSEESFDFCDNCSEVPFEHEIHNSSHRLQPITTPCLDTDYMSFTKTDYNYLDSNYMPAN